MERLKIFFRTYKRFRMDIDGMWLEIIYSRKRIIRVTDSFGSEYKFSETDSVVTQHSNIVNVGRVIDGYFWGPNIFTYKKHHILLRLIEVAEYHRLCIIERALL